MKARLLYFFLLLSLGTVPASWGQTSAADVGNPMKELRAALQSLDTSPSRLPTGVLLNRIMPLTNPHRFAGQGDTAVSYSSFEQQYGEFYHAAIDSSRLQTLDALRTSSLQRI